MNSVLSVVYNGRGREKKVYSVDAVGHRTETGSAEAHLGPKADPVGPCRSPILLYTICILRFMALFDIFNNSHHASKPR